MYTCSELSELQEQRAAIQESLCESIVEGTNEEVEFFRFLYVDIERGIATLEKHLHSKS
jgi:hypothetical protein